MELETERKLFDELQLTIDTLEVWIEPSKELLTKLEIYRSVSYQLLPGIEVEYESGIRKLIPNNEEDRKTWSDWQFLKEIISLEDDLIYVATPIEKIIIIQYAIVKLEGRLRAMYRQLLKTNYEKLLKLFHAKEHYLQTANSLSRGTEEQLRDLTRRILRLEAKTKLQNIGDEQTEAYKVLSEIFEKKGKPFWSGSLSDFVYAMNILAANHYVKKNEMEVALAESFEHKPTSKKTAQPIKPESIKKRLREVNSSSSPHKASSRIQTTMKAMLEGMADKQKKD